MGASGERCGSLWNPAVRGTEGPGRDLSCGSVLGASPSTPLSRAFMDVLNQSQRPGEPGQFSSPKPRLSRALQMPKEAKEESEQEETVRRARRNQKAKRLGAENCRNISTDSSEVKNTLLEKGGLGWIKKALSIPQEIQFHLN